MSHIFLVAAEASGDAMGADVIDALRRTAPQIQISGIGGELMRERGVSSDVDMSGLAVIGLIEGLKAYGRVKKAVEDAADVIASADPDSVVLIDSWGFMWRLARALKLRGVRAKRIKLIGPQVWATRPGRARVLAQWVDHRWLWLAVFVGLNLLQSGFTDFCPLERILLKLGVPKGGCSTGGARQV